MGSLYSVGSGIWSCEGEDREVGCPGKTVQSRNMCIQQETRVWSLEEKVRKSSHYKAETDEIRNPEE